MMIMGLSMVVFLLTGNTKNSISGASAATVAPRGEDTDKDDVLLPPKYEISSLTFSELQSACHKNDYGSTSCNALMDSLTTTGIVSIVDIDNMNDHHPNERQQQGRFTEARSHAFDGLCQCISDKADTFLSSIDNTDVAFLDDGFTTRTTLATATAVRDIPFPLPTEQIDSVCSSRSDSSSNKKKTLHHHPQPQPHYHHRRKLSDNLETLRDYVHRVSQEFVHALDRMIVHQQRNLVRSNREQELLRTKYGKSYPTVHSIITDSNHLEHFHVYSKIMAKKVTTEDDDDESQNEEEESTEQQQQERFVDTALRTHTDAGLFLSFVPAASCHKNYYDHDDTDDDSSSSFQEDTSFLVSVNGSLRTAVFPSWGNSVVIMLGAGAQHWINNMPQGLPLKATKHGVQMNDGAARAWYGMMHLVPETAILQESPRQLTLADMRSSMVLRHPNRTFGDNSYRDKDMITIGCGSTSADDPYEPERAASTTAPLGLAPHRRRLQMVADASACNNVTNLYCWMSCLDIPDHENAVDHLVSGESLYCADYTKLDQGLDAAVRECRDPYTKVVGGAMNTNCMGTWHTTVDGIYSQQLDIELPEDSSHSSVRDSSEDEKEYTTSETPAYEEPFCFGGTSMFMDGFHWSSLVCVIYLFPSWVLDTRGKLIGASIGTLFFGIAIECVIYCRGAVVRQWQGTKVQKLAISTIFYGAQLTMGYLIMLVVMTYSGPLFLCTILGLMIGHFSFQYLNLLQSKNDYEIPEGSTPCCPKNMVVSTKSEKGTATTENKKKKDYYKTVQDVEKQQQLQSVDMAPSSSSSPCCQTSSKVTKSTVEDKKSDYTPLVTKDSLESSPCCQQHDQQETQQTQMGADAATTAAVMDSTTSTKACCESTTPLERGGRAENMDNGHDGDGNDDGNDGIAPCCQNTNNNNNHDMKEETATRNMGSSSSSVSSSQASEPTNDNQQPNPPCCQNKL